MGIIVNNDFTDDRGYSSSGTYASFSKQIVFEKVNETLTNSITAEDASGNTNAYAKQEYIRDASGNLTTDASGNYIIETNYFEDVTVQRYRIVSIFSQYKDKEARSTGREPLKSYKVRLSIELSDFSKMFELLYNKVKTDNNVFPFDDLTDDL